MCPLGGPLHRHRADGRALPRARDRARRAGARRHRLRHARRRRSLGPAAAFQAGSSGPRSITRETARSRSVERSAYKASDVRHVVVTHLDLDHAGGISDFPGATVHLHAREHAAAMARATLRERERYHVRALVARPEVVGLHRGRRHLARVAGGHAAARHRRRDRARADARPHARPLGGDRERRGERWLVHAGDAYFHRHAVDRSARLGPARVARVRDGSSRPTRAARRASVVGAAPAARELRRRRAVLRARHRRVCRAGASSSESPARRPRSRTLPSACSARRSAARSSCSTSPRCRSVTSSAAARRRLHRIGPTTAYWMLVTAGDVDARAVIAGARRASSST